MPGYKQTEVGLIPEDWNTHVLRDCCSKVTDGTHDTPTPVRMGCPYLTAIHVKDNRIDFDSCLYLTETDHRAIYRRCDPKRNDVLMVNIGAGVATAALVNVDFEFSLKNVALLKPDSRKLSGPFLSYILAHRKPEITKDLSSGGAQPFLSLNQIGGIEIPVPPTKAEQEAIAESLSQADALVESIEQLIAKKVQIKRAAMQELLTGKKRLVGFAQTTSKVSEIGPVPCEWSVLEIGQIADVKTGPFGSSLHERDYVDDGIPIITVEHLGDRGITHANLPMVSEIDRKRLNAYTLQEGDIVFSRVGSVDRNARVSGKEAGWLFSGRLLRVRASFRDVDTRFLSHQFHSEAFKQRVRTVAVGQTMASLNTQILRGVLVSLPSITEQTAIADVLSDMDQEIAENEARLEKARDLKKGMMQELLTGRIRLV